MQRESLRKVGKQEQNFSVRFSFLRSWVPQKSLNTQLTTKN